MENAPEAAVTPEVKTEKQTFSNEIWKSLPPPDNDYQISNMGRFRSRIKHRHHDYLPTFGHDNGIGYRFVKFMSQGKRATRYVHRLVAEAFIPNSGNKPHINHIDGDKSNNRADNLEWASQSDQEVHKIYVLNKINPSLLHSPKKVMCKETGETFRSLNEAHRETGIPLSSLFYAVTKGIRAKDNTRWEYIK